jgi:chitinase
MSYDMHGGWDKPNKWTGPYLNAHTNLTEITDALDLLWRNYIKPSQVVMGLGFYGRTFTASSPSCLTPGCKFTDVGKAGPCSREPGILTNAEIVDIMKSKKITPQLYKKEAVKVLSWDDIWVAYDDAQTLQLKTEFARGQCLGGVMVWAISHDLDDGRFSAAVGNAAGRKSLSSPKKKSPYKFMEEVEVVQCRWTSCGEGKTT